MISEELLEEFRQRRDNDPQKLLRLTEDELKALTSEDVDAVIEFFHKQAMLALPPNDVLFFEWLKANDPVIWHELWDDSGYTVSIAFLRSFAADGHGFPIGDLIDNPNYYFHKDFIVDIGKENLVKDIMEKVRNEEHLTMDNIFLLEIWIHPTDIWRFAFKYGYALNEVKDMIQRLVDQGIILHLKNREEIADFIEW